MDSLPPAVTALSDSEERAPAPQRVPAASSASRVAASLAASPGSGAAAVPAASPASRVAAGPAASPARRKRLPEKTGSGAGVLDKKPRTAKTAASGPGGPAEPPLAAKAGKTVTGGGVADKKAKTAKAAPPAPGPAGRAGPADPPTADTNSFESHVEKQVTVGKSSKYRKVFAWSKHGGQAAAERAAIAWDKAKRAETHRVCGPGARGLERSLAL